MQGNDSKTNKRSGQVPERNQLVTVDDLEIFKIELLNDLRNILQQNQPCNTSKRWLRSREVRKILGISAGTLQSFRVSGLLPFTKIGTIWFYKEEDIFRILESNSRREF